MYKILVMKGISRYNVLRRAADEVIEGFQSLGHHVDVMDLSQEEDLNLVNVLDYGQYQLVYSFQALCFELIVDENETPLFAKFPDTKFVGHIVDLPIYHRHRLSTNHSSNMYIAVIDRNHIDFIKKHYTNVKNVEFIPHGGFAPTMTIPYAEKKIDVFFSSSYESPMVALEKIDRLESVFLRIAENVINKMMELGDWNLDKMLRNYLREVKFDCTEEEYLLILTSIFEVDEFVRFITRHNLVYDLLEAGIHVTVCGQGWEKFPKDYKDRLTILSSEGMDIDASNQLMANAKIVINQAPTLIDGTHERVFSAMRSGSVAVTHDYSIWKEYFTDEENVILYDGNNPIDLASKIKYLLQNPIDAEKIAKAGQSIAESKHKWEDNAQRILTYLGL